MQANHPRSCNDHLSTGSNRHRPLNLLGLLCLRRSYCSSYQSFLFSWSTLHWKQVIVTDITLAHYNSCNLPNYYGYFCNYRLLCNFGTIFQVRMDDFTSIYYLYWLLIRSSWTLTTTNRLIRLGIRLIHRYLTMMIFFIYYLCQIHWTQRW
jgi:hypothetical protein